MYTFQRAILPTGSTSPTDGEFELRFESLFHPGRGIAFPCDASGDVDLDHMSEHGRTAYLAARAMIGREYSYPVVVPTLH